MLTERDGDAQFRVLVLLPTRRDMEAIQRLFDGAVIGWLPCNGVSMLVEQMGSGVGAIMMTDAALGDPHIHQLISAMESQPLWSDIPIVLLCHSAPQSAVAARLIGALRNVTVLDRPSSSRTLISSIQAALRARERQYRMREQFLELQRAEKALEMANRRKDEFLAMLAHELRNPLTPIGNAMEILARALAENPKVQTMADIVRRQLRHLTRLVDDLLDVSRITTGRIQLKRKPSEISAVVAQALETAEPLIRGKRHTVMVRSGLEPLYVEGDQERLIQSIANILINAAKYTDPGGNIEIEVRKQDARVHLTISDNGAGISAELLPQIFELFVQDERSLDRSQGGLGIGLAVVRRLIEMHHGEVTAVSPGLGLGSTFTITLPLIEAPAPVEAVLQRGASEPKRVLIVDDNVDAADSLAMMLKMDGHETEAVYSSKNALERAAAFEPDVVLLDIGLPEMDGYEVAVRLRPILGAARIIAITGYGQSEDIRRAEAAGFDAHVVKPIDFQLLGQCLRFGGEDQVGQR